MPYPAAVSEPFWAAARRHELVVQQCTACDALAFYPRSTCPSCGSAELDWRPVSGNGTLHSLTVARRATHPKLADRVPYVIAVVLALDVLRGDLALELDLLLAGHALLLGRGHVLLLPRIL